MKRILLSVIVLILITCTVGCSEDKVDVNNSISQYGHSTSKHEVKISYINAGKADATLIKIDDKAYLIDTGKKSSVDNIESVLNENGIHMLDGVFLTHTHDDHIGGLSKLSKKFSIDKLYAANISYKDKKNDNEIDLAASNCNLEVNRLKAGEHVSVIDDVNFVVLGPLNYNDEDDNDNSLVLRLEVNGVVMLFTGDMQFAEETTLLDEGIDVKADILKVGNHGNKDASSEEFIKGVSPKFAMISTDTSKDENSANKKVIKRLEGAEIYITQDFGTGINVRIDGDGEINVEEK